MKTSVTELSDSRVRVEVDVDAADLDRRLERTARGLGRELKVPGFRKGKVPAEVVMQRIGRDAVMDETLRDALPEWYERALLDAGVIPIGDPKLDVAGMPQEGEPLSFSIEVAVRPGAKLGTYRGLEVGRTEPEVPDDAVDAELERIRDGMSSLRPIERAAKEGDSLLVDYTGEIDGEPFEGGEARDFLLELGAEGGLLDGFAEALTGASAGDERDVDVHFPDGYQPERLAGRDATFKVSVKEVREKQLPELDDDLAAQASEFDTLAELREEIESKIREALEQRADDEFREAAVDAAAAEASVEIPDDVIESRATEMWERVERQLQSRGIAPDSYLQMQNRSREDLISEARPDAERALRREAVLAAIADEESIQASDEELVEALRHTAEHEGTSPEKLLERLRSAGRDSLLREELRLRKAADIVADSAKPIPKQQAEAREKLWTPEKESASEGGEGGLWTPGSE